MKSYNRNEISPFLVSGKQFTGHCGLSKTVTGTLPDSRIGIELTKLVIDFPHISGYKNCADLLENGFDENGVYPVAMNNKEHETFNVYCDQESKWGGKQDQQWGRGEGLESGALPYLAQTDKCR